MNVNLQDIKLLDYFAGQYLNGMISGVWANPDVQMILPVDAASTAYDYARAMLNERFKRDENGDLYPEYRPGYKSEVEK